MKQKKNGARQRESGDKREIGVKGKILLYGKKKIITHFKVQMKDEKNTGSTH